MFRIRHIPTGRFIKKSSGAMWWSADLINNNEIDQATTNGLGHSYNTETGANNFLKIKVGLK